MRKVLVGVTALTVLTLMTQPSGATFPGGNGKIAYFDLRQFPTQVHAIDPDGSGEVQLTSGRRFSFAPEWSADGTKIVFLQGNSPFVGGALVTMNADGSGKTVLLRGGVGRGRDGLRTPTWSPDGSQIAFCAAGRRKPYKIYVINADGSGLEKVTRGPNVDCHPSWSPDGNRLAMLTFVPHRWQLATMDPDGSNREVLVDRGDNDNSDWSPDGSQIVFTRTLGQNRSDVFVVDSDGSGRTRLTDTPRRWEWTPVFSPNGTRIAFVKGQGSNFLARGDIFTMLTDGSGVVRVTDTKQDEYWLSWQAT